MSAFNAQEFFAKVQAIFAKLNTGGDWAGIKDEVLTFVKGLRRPDVTGLLEAIHVKENAILQMAPTPGDRATLSDEASHDLSVLGGAAETLASGDLRLAMDGDISAGVMAFLERALPVLASVASKLV